MELQIHEASGRLFVEYLISGEQGAVTAKVGDILTDFPPATYATVVRSMSARGAVTTALVRRNKNGKDTPRV